jgi:glycosyltransferase involved in cell wall biosynthesis
VATKHVWIINEYAGAPNIGMEYRHYYLGKALINFGDTVTIVSSSYSHLFKNLPKRGRENIDGINYLWLRVINYRNSHNKRRVIKWLIFTFKCFFLPFMIKRPDVIIVSPMVPFSFLPAWVLSKIYNVKVVYEVKDIWPLSLVELGGFKKSHPFIKIMYWFEDFALKKSDVIVSNLPNYGEHVRELGISREFKWISNGFALDSMNKVEKLPPDVRCKIPKNKFIVGYAGTIGVANALDSFLESYSYIDNKDVCFVIVGDGQEKDRLVNKYYSESIIFIDSISKNKVQSMLQLFDVCFLGWKKENLYKYGTSANKIFDYMFSGKPILNAYSGKGDLVQLANCGISVEAQNSKMIANSILALYNMSIEKREELGANGKEYVLKYFSYEELAKKYKELF